jgi:hypothetical protein
LTDGTCHTLRDVERSGRSLILRFFRLFLLAIVIIIVVIRRRRRSASPGAA